MMLLITPNLQNKTMRKPRHKVKQTLFQKQDLFTISFATTQGKNTIQVGRERHGNKLNVFVLGD